MPVQYFGREVTCVHCGGEFRADEHAAAVPCSQASGSLASGGAPLPGLMPAGLVPHNSLPVTEGR
jgi:hypothetical protein